MRRRRLIAFLAAAALIGGCGGDDDEPDRKTPVAPVPGPLINGRPSAGDPLAPADRRAARAATDRFLRSYLPYLYGRAEPTSVQPVTPDVARVLRSSRARVTPAQAERRPRVTALELLGQSRRSALVTVTVADGGPAPIRLVLTVERRDGRWVIADLGDDR